MKDLKKFIYFICEKHRKKKEKSQIQQLEKELQSAEKELYQNLTPEFIENYNTEVRKIQEAILEDTPFENEKIAKENI